jgi:hypothetical protein
MKMRMRVVVETPLAMPTWAAGSTRARFDHDLAVTIPETGCARAR